MQDAPLYPSSPKQVPENLTKAKSSYKKQAWLAMTGLLVFMAGYLILLACFGLISFNGLMAIKLGELNLVSGLITFSSSLLMVFMIKSLFSVRKHSDPDGVEVSVEQEPELYAFLNTLADEIGAPRPYRIFLTPEVNAAVFYDLSLMNLFFPSKKNLIIGLGLVNVLSLGEIKAVLAHEFGHFAQGSMMVGRWVYIAQQIISHMVVTRDWLDSVVRFISRFDLRVAWIGWILGIILWSIRSLVDTLFNLVIMAERALSREMEFNADLVAVSVTGSDALINALHKLQAADHAWQTALNVADSEASGGRVLGDLFAAQETTVTEMRRILSDDSYGATPSLPEESNKSAHRVFSEDMARPPQMWATHPANRDREDNAKAVYVEADIDERSAWDIFNDEEGLRKKISISFYNEEKIKGLEVQSSSEAVIKRFDKASYAEEYRGTYLNRSVVRNFEKVDDLLNDGEVKLKTKDSLLALYPESLANELEVARNLDIERDTLEALERGDLKPSGGVIRHRGEDLKKSEIADAIQIIIDERMVVAKKLKSHDACCRRAHLQAAEEVGSAWTSYLESLIYLLHCVEHLGAYVENEHALMANTWEVILADGQVGWFEKRRMIKVCKKVHNDMREISTCVEKLTLPKVIEGVVGIDNWKEQRPIFEFNEVNNENWGEWCPEASTAMQYFINILDAIQGATLEELIQTEALIKKRFISEGSLPDVPASGSCPDDYPTLMPGNEHILQRKLDLWNRFQLAHGFMPTLARLVCSLGIVGGTIYGGLIGI